MTNSPSDFRWNAARPHVMVVACSDGRLQKAIDEFLQGTLGITDYDRLYAPGGPGVLATGGFELLRADQYRQGCTFLVKAHELEQLILIFHGAAPGGPEESACAHYRRLMPGHTAAEMNAQQERDVTEIMSYLRTIGMPVRIAFYRAEVHADKHVEFVPLAAEKVG